MTPGIPRIDEARTRAYSIHGGEVFVPIRIQIVDEQQLFRDGLRAIFGFCPDFEVVAEAEDARSAYRAFETSNPDLVTLDVALPGASGITAATELLARDAKAKIFTLTALRKQRYVSEALKAGVMGFALKCQPQREIVEAIRSVAAGHHYLSPLVSACVVDSFLRGQRGEHDSSDPLHHLSPREREIFDLLVRGYSNQDAARQLCISVKTVETHRAHLMKKLHVHSMVELIRFAAGNDLLLLDADATRV